MEKIQVQIHATLAAVHDRCYLVHARLVPVVVSHTMCFLLFNCPF
jgi:hypothetical protein